MIQEANYKDWAEKIKDEYASLDADTKRKVSWSDFKTTSWSWIKNSIHNGIKEEDIDPSSMYSYSEQGKHLELVKSTLRKWLHIKDEAVVDIVFAFAISEKLLGDPLWLFLIAPPGGCKTELLRAMDGGDYYHLSDLTPKTFVSGLMLGKGKERKKIQDLLPQLDKKVLIMKDFTTILEKNKDERREIIAQLREIYDGMFSKKFGTMDKKIEYRSRFGIIAGVTPIIDKHWKIMQQLGERFLKYRWDEDEDKTTRRAEKNEGKEKIMRVEIHEAVMKFLDELQIPKDVKLPKELVEPIIQISKFLAVCRTPVSIRSSKSDFYFEFIPTPERPTRLVKQLKKLSKCLAIVRSKPVVTKEEVDTAIDVALNTCPQDRLNVLKAITQTQHSSIYGCTIPQIAHGVQLPRTSVGHICEQLYMLGLVHLEVVTTNSGGYSSEVQYYKLKENVPALPTLFSTDTSNKRGVEGAEIVKEELVS